MHASPRCPKCGRVEWVGRGRVILPGPDHAVCVEDEHADEPEWTCNGCRYVTRTSERPSPLVAALDGACADPAPPSPELVAKVRLVLRAITARRDS